jgi:hypothetical protein
MSAIQKERKMNKITAFDVQAWLGDHPPIEAIQVIADVVNGDWAVESLREDIMSTAEHFVLIREDALASGGKTAEVVEMTMGKILEWLNKDRSENWSAYDASDWEEGMEQFGYPYRVPTKEEEAKIKEGVLKWRI